ncbi:MAG: DUF202 domain-containing protein [Nitriliruptoraceae bacterium]
MTQDQTQAHPPDGVQPERTSLAWQRTALSFTVASLAMLRLAVGRGMTAAGLLAVVAIAIGLFAAVEGTFYHRRRRRTFEQQYPQLPRSAVLLIVATPVLALGGLVLSVV